MRGLIIFLLLTSLLLFSGGCASVKRPEKNLEERLAYDASAKARYKLEANWWEVYGDPQLNDLIQRALKENIDLAKAAISVNRALYQANLIESDLFPRFSGNLDATSRKNIRTGGPSSRSAGGSLTLSYEVDLWRKLAASASAAEWEYLATIEDEDAARLALINNTVDSYYNLSYINDAISANQKNLNNLKSIESTIKLKHEAGKVSSLETAQARQSVLSAENKMTELNTQRKTAEQNLRNLLNLKPDQDLGFNKALTLEKLKLAGVNLDIPLSVLANRPDLKAAEFRIEKAFKNVEEAERAWLPSISLSSALASSANSISQAMNYPSANLAIAVNLPFLDWNNVLNKLRISETDFESIRLDFEKSLTTALNEVDSNYYIYLQARKTLDKTRQSYTNDVRISAYYQDRYESGATELSDWLSALNTVNNSRLSALDALYQALKYENMVYKTMAGRWLDVK